MDKKKIKEAAKKYGKRMMVSCNEFAKKHESTIPTVGIVSIAPDVAFQDGVKWAINELLKDLFHPASEVPRNDNGKVLAFSKVFGNRKLYNMNAMLDKTTCNTYQEMWEEQVNIFHLSDWIFVDELFDLITKGGEE